MKPYGKGWKTPEDSLEWVEQILVVSLSHIGILSYLHRYSKPHLCCAIGSFCWKLYPARVRSAFCSSRFFAQMMPGSLYYMHAVDMLLEKNYELLPENFGRIRAMTLLTACQSDRMPIVEQNKSIDNLNRGWLSALMGYLG